MKFTFIWRGIPRGQERPRFGGTVYKSAEAKAYENEIALAYRTAVSGSCKPLTCPLGISIIAGYPIPRSDTKAAKEQKRAGVILPTVKPDVDNVAKAVLDALNRAREELEAQGLDAGRFRRAKRASLGARLRGLEDFESVCFALASGTREGYCALDGPTMLESVEKAECERFLLDVLQPERLALAILEPKKEGQTHD